MIKTTVDKGFDFIRAVRREHGEETAYQVFCAVQDILPKEWGSRVLFRRMSHTPEPECIRMTAVGPKKINVIKTIRAHTGLGLREAKHITDIVQSNSDGEEFGHNLSKEQLENFSEELWNDGATVELID